MQILHKAPARENIFKQTIKVDTLSSYIHL